MPRCLRTFSIRSGLLAPAHSFAMMIHEESFYGVLPSNDRISMILFSRMKRASVYRTYKRRWLWREVLWHLRHLARKQAVRAHSFPVPRLGASSIEHVVARMFNMFSQGRKEARQVR
ncbi:hypothetical protein H5410_001689 [Solanum commersonii]|uniref:Uncharacterized protein n=1 Tax=Solanum commersonii TaxID=4109 RepID=A0A9J6AZV4_SOLCO|nr:hypothetical protein H5410_001689 [Solanum commersonii]